MHLTWEEGRMLAGRDGQGVQKAMQLLAALGDVLGADRLIPITSAQVAGVSYGNIGDAGMELLEDWAGSGAKVRVPTTLNPAGMDLVSWRLMGVDQEYHDKQLRIIKAFERMGVRATCTCTPYLVGNLPKMGEHIAWSESSAIGYANSFLGAMTNREGGPSALAAALAGKTPRYGLHLKENRRATVIIDVDPSAGVRTANDFSVLGYAVGMAVGSGIPFFTGIGSADSDRVKIMSAALAAAGGIAIFHIKGVTPEARAQRLDGLERVPIGAREMGEAKARLTAEGSPDLACIGCPHCSIDEIRDVARLVEGRRVAAGKGLWVWTSRGVYGRAKRRGFVGTIERAGGKVFVDTCMVVCPLGATGFRHMATNSCKAAHYVMSAPGMKASIAELHEVIAGVVEGGRVEG